MIDGKFWSQMQSNGTCFVLATLHLLNLLILDYSTYVALPDFWFEFSSCLTDLTYEVNTAADNT